MTDPIHEQSLLSFHKEMISDLYYGHNNTTTLSNNEHVESQQERQHDLPPLDAQDGLLILAHGLGLSLVLSNIISIHAHSKNLVLLLNTHESETGRYPLTRIIKSDTPASLRKELYLQGGVISVTSRILVVDMLNHIIPIHLISGVLIHHAHKVTESSMEAFILRLFRDENKVGFIKAFSESPEHFLHSFSVSQGSHNGSTKLEACMKYLFLRDVYFWPRFHVHISNALDEYGAVSLVELRVPLTKRMTLIQASILDCLHQCILELKRLNPALDGEDLTMENALFSSFESIVKRQLDPVWNRVSSRTKQLFIDMKILRRLLGYLVSYDAVTFYSFLETIRASSIPSGTSSSSSTTSWIILDAAETLFRTAKERVYTVQKSVDETTDHKRPRFEYTPVLEQQPKWRALVQILQEIYEKKAPGEKVLIMAREPRTCRQLTEILKGTRINSSVNMSFSSKPAKKTFLSPGTKQLMTRLLHRFAGWKGGLQALMAQISETNQSNPENNSMVDNNNNVSTTSTSSSFTSRSGQPVNKRRRVRGGGSSGSSSTSRTLNATPSSESMIMNLSQRLGSGGADVLQGFDEEALAELASMLDVDMTSDDFFSDPDGQGRDGSREDNDDVDPNMIEDSTQQSFSIPTPGPQVQQQQQPSSNIPEEEYPDLCLRSYYSRLDTLSLQTPLCPFTSSSSLSSGSTVPSNPMSTNEDEDFYLLKDLDPTYIIMYDPDMAFVRRIEVFKSLKSRLRQHRQQQKEGEHDSERDKDEEDPVHVYFMVYDQSIEEQQYLTSLRREKDAFEKLIQQKRTMVIPMDRDGRRKDEVEDLLLVDSRRSGGQSQVLKREVIVDVREFRSSLPLLLYKRRLSLAPVTLEVGDYILSPRICVERKAIPDLVSSLKSGRLFSQCENMTLYYEVPLVLIEFDRVGAFQLQSQFLARQGPASLSASSAAATLDVSSRLVLLCLHFPKVGFLWSSSPAQTALMFDDLKKNEKEPSAEKAMSVGTNPGSTTGVNSSYAVTPYELLRSLPGVTQGNIHLVLANARNVREVSEWSREKAISVLGEVNGVKLYDFIHFSPGKETTGRRVVGRPKIQQI